MSKPINGRTAEKIRFNIMECAHGHCLSECPYDSSDECVEDLLDDALALIERLEAAQPRWISVEERLPEEDVYLLVSVKLNGNRGMYTDVAMFDGEMWVRDAGSYFDILDKGNVTHYMPLPEPPKEDAHD